MLCLLMPVGLDTIDMLLIIIIQTKFNLALNSCKGGADGMCQDI